MQAETIMSQPTQSIIQARPREIFPVLEAAEIERLRRFGRIRSYGAGEALAKVDAVGEGLIIVLDGRVEVTWRGEQGRPEPIVVYGAGQFLGELAQLSGRPAFVDANAL